MKGKMREEEEEDDEEVTKQRGMDGGEGMKKM